MLMGYITWEVDPELFQLGPFSIRYYGLMFAAAFYFGYYFLSKIFKKENVSIEVLDKLTIYAAIGTILGARLGHCLFYEPGYFLKHPLEIFIPWKGIPFTENFEFTGYQGLASHGGILGIVIAFVFFTRKYKIGMLWLLDRASIVGTLGGFFIRMGNLFNSEIYGHETNLPWGFKFVLRGETVPKHPTQLYEALSYLLIFVSLYVYYNRSIHKKNKPQNGLIFSIFLITLFLARFLIEFVKENQEEFEEGMALNMGQWLSVPFIVVGIVMFVMVRKGMFAKQKD
jgi:phosphatidylglycerol---prolipoprotein diacylglyceryl transferase